MQQIIRGKAFVVGDNIDTDQIIPAEYLNYNPSDPSERKYFGLYAMSGVPVAQSGLPEGNIPFIDAGGGGIALQNRGRTAQGDGATRTVAPPEFTCRYAVIVGGRNFGCGSSREHAPVAIAEAGVKAVVAESYARIFYRNSVNAGLLVPLETPQRLVDKVATGDEVEVDVQAAVLRNLTRGATYSLKPLGDAAEIVAAGGIFPFAREKGMLKK
jgi:3-isopropylmalate/(R)-2-methylmalate dehydratase small subunit